MDKYLTLIGIVLTAIISLHTFRRRLWSKIVSESRNKWINDFRDEIGLIVSTLRIIYLIQNSNLNINNDWLLEKIYEAEKAKARLLTKLNTSRIEGNVKNFPLNDLLNKIEFDISINVNFSIFEEINELTKKILEPEWQRVKSEAKGKMR